MIEVAQAWRRRRSRSPTICTYWWEKVVQYEPTHDEALAELYKLYERNKEWDKLADICQRQADAASDAKVRADALQRLGLLYTEKVENSAKAIDAWQKLLAIDENNRRAQDALKKLYVTEGRWDELEEFYSLARQGRRVHPRARARGRGRQRDASALARDEDRGALPRHAAEGRPRDARVREGAARSTRTTSPPPRR